ncbi:MAG: transporter substrate-binding domain-containing protein [Actinocrinis sp.]
MAATGDFPVAADVKLAGSATFQRMSTRDQGARRIVIGVKDDQPGLGYYDEGSKSYSGFDVEIAEMIAAGLGFSRAQIQFVPVTSANRENALQNGSVDLVVASYSYTSSRAKEVYFAGPYFETIEGLLLRTNQRGVTSMNSLTSANSVCSISASTSYNQISQLTSAQSKSRDTYSECVTALESNQVDGVYTDLAVLAGYAAQDPGKLRLIEVPNAAAPQLYGIGLPYGDDALRTKIDSILLKAEKDGTWQAIFNATLEPSGIKAVIPHEHVWTTG